MIRKTNICLLVSSNTLGRNKINNACSCNRSTFLFIPGHFVDFLGHTWLALKNWSVLDIQFYIKHGIYKQVQTYLEKCVSNYFPMWRYRIILKHPPKNQNSLIWYESNAHILIGLYIRFIIITIAVGINHLEFTNKHICNTFANYQFFILCVSMLYLSIKSFASLILAAR